MMFYASWKMDVVGRLGRHCQSMVLESGLVWVNIFAYSVICAFSEIGIHFIG